MGRFAAGASAVLGPGHRFHEGADSREEGEFFLVIERLHSTHCVMDRITGIGHAGQRDAVIRIGIGGPVEERSGGCLGGIAPQSQPLTADVAVIVVALLIPWNQHVAGVIAAIHEETHQRFVIRDVGGRDGVIEQPQVEQGIGGTDAQAKSGSIPQEGAAGKDFAGGHGDNGMGSYGKRNGSAGRGMENYFWIANSGHIEKR